MTKYKGDRVEAIMFLKTVGEPLTEKRIKEQMGYQVMAKDMHDNSHKRMDAMQRKLDNTE